MPHNRRAERVAFGCLLTVISSFAYVIAGTVRDARDWRRIRRSRG